MLKEDAKPLTLALPLVSRQTKWKKDELGVAAFKKNLDYYWTQFKTKVLKEHGVSEKTIKSYNLRSVRCYHAKVFVERYCDFKVLGLKFHPPNPLQHTTVKTAINTYAPMGTDDENKAYARANTYSEEMVEEIMRQQAALRRTKGR